MTKFHPKKKFGQNFLIDTLIIQKIIDGFNLHKEDNIIEIGPGHGALTKYLSQHVNNFCCVELDSRLIGNLTQIVGVNNVYNADILKFDFKQLAKPLRIVGNLPYCISSQIIMHCLDNLQLVEDMNFMLQLELAKRVCAAPKTKDYGRLSVRVQVFCEADLWLNVSNVAFDPVPKVESAMIRLKPLKSRPNVDMGNLDKVLLQAFSMRRKKIKNNLKGLFSINDLEKIGINPDLRPEEISVDQYILLANNLT